jgi:hypothetical protein
MCLIIRGSVSGLLSLDLEYAEISNADGFGIHTADTVFYSFDYPDTDSRTILESLLPDTIATVHYRYATHGPIIRDNCHPFRLDDKQTYLMHNGVLRGNWYVCPDGLRSDTSILANDLSKLSHSKRCKLLDYHATSNRFCMLRGDRWRKFGNWHYCSATKTWHSNRLIIPSQMVRNADFSNPLKWDYADDYFTSDDMRYFSNTDWKRRIGF